MSKKNKKKHATVLQSLRDLGSVPRETLSRLATTVKTDTSPLALKDTPKGGGATVRSTPAPAMKSRFSLLAQKVNPLSAQRRADRKSQKKLKKIAKQMAGGPVMKARRSRLPLFALAFVLLLAGGGYWLYQSISLPHWNVSRYVDHKKWLNVVSGNVKPGDEAVARHRSHTVRKVAHKTGEPQRVAAQPKVKSKASRLASGKATKHEKAFKKLSKAEKKKAWKKKLAKLQKQSESKYKRASHQYRRK